MVKNRGIFGKCKVQLLVYILAVALAMYLAATPSAIAADTKLSQQIFPIGCDHDTYATGRGVVNNPACPPFSPVISSYERLPNGGLMAYGAYDAIHTDINPLTTQHRLSITFAGKVFTLGIDPELTVDGNAWELNLSHWRDSESTSSTSTISPIVLNPGTLVDSQVMTTMKPVGDSTSKDTLTGKATITMPNYPRDITSSEKCSTKNSQQTPCSSTNSRNDSGWLVTILFMLIGFETLLLILLGKKRRKQVG